MVQISKSKRIGEIIKIAALPILGGILLATSFPNFDIAIFAWFCLIPLLWNLTGSKSKHLFIQGFLFGVIYFYVSLFWVRRTMIDYGNLSVSISLLILFLLAGYCAIYVGVFAVMASQAIRRKQVPIIVAFPMIWVSLEFLRGHLITGFPWNAIGLSQYSNLWLLQNADWGSYYAISFILVLANTCIYLILKRNFSRLTKITSTVFAVSLIFLCWVYGIYRLNKCPNSMPFSVGIVQANVPQNIKWNQNTRELILKRHLELSQTAIDEDIDLILWPESAITFYYRYGWRYFDGNGRPLSGRIKNLVNTEKIPILLGTLDRVNDRTYNGAVLVTPEGLEQYYHKRHLVPFGEYVPLKSLLFFVNRLVEDTIGTFDHGKTSANLQMKSTGLAVTICYENIFPALVRESVLEGADIICNLTNDAWFGRTSASKQHFSASCFRAVETRRPVIRAANTGISGAVDTRGRITYQSPLFDSLAAKVEVFKGVETSFYLKYGDVFAWFCIVISLISIIPGIKFKK